MIPLGDTSRPPLSFPIVTAGLVATNAFVFVLELIGGDDFINAYSMVPADVVSGQHLYTVFTSMNMAVTARVFEGRRPQPTIQRVLTRAETRENRRVHDI